MKFTLLIISIIFHTASYGATPLAPGLKFKDKHTITSDKNLLKDISAINSDGSINVVIEIPAGTSEKWEVSKPDGKLKRDFKNNKPRSIKYLSYPGNYGMIPRTLLPKDMGGDGDPLDVIVLGEAVPRGSIVKTKIIGVLKLLDGGEQDDKLIGVATNGTFKDFKDMKSLEGKHPGVTHILTTWFQFYKGPGKMEVIGVAGPDVAQTIFKTSVKSFK